MLNILDVSRQIIKYFINANNVRNNQEVDWRLFEALM